jgi:hypothetical protein
VCVLAALLQAHLRRELHLDGDLLFSVRPDEPVRMRPEEVGIVRFPAYHMWLPQLPVGSSCAARAAAAHIGSPACDRLYSWLPKYAFRLWAQLQPPAAGRYYDGRDVRAVAH